jgi:hypothetical protein
MKSRTRAEEPTLGIKIVLTLLCMAGTIATFYLFN